MVAISPRVLVPSTFTHAWRADDFNGLPTHVTMHCAWDTKSRRFQIERLEILPADREQPISSQLIRRLPIGALLEKASRTHLVLFARVDSPSGFISMSRAMDDFTDNLREKLKQEGPRSPETLEWISLIYEVAAAEGYKPTQSVSEWFNISLRTASNWVRLARETGVLQGG